MPIACTACADGKMRRTEWPFLAGWAIIRISGIGSGVVLLVAWAVAYFDDTAKDPYQYAELPLVGGMVAGTLLMAFGETFLPEARYACRRCAATATFPTPMTRGTKVILGTFAFFAILIVALMGVAYAATVLKK